MFPAFALETLETSALKLFTLAYLSYILSK